MTDIKKQEPKKVTDLVLARVATLQESNAINLPDDYSPGNAVKAAELILRETTNKAGVPVLESCSKESIANALLEMIIMGLSPIKKQAYFVAYGKKLTLMPSYHGRVAMAKRVGLKEINANVIYEGDVFEYATDPMTGRISIVKHEQLMANIDLNKITGAYAVYIMNSGEVDVEIMTIAQIKKAWMQGAAKGESPAHKGFGDEMSKKTVIGRACKSIINRSTDSYLFDTDSIVKNNEIKIGENDTSLDFAEAEEVPEETPGSEDGSEKPPEENKTEQKSDQPGMDQASIDFQKEEAIRIAKEKKDRIEPGF